VPVQHQAGAAARAGQRGDRLQASRLDPLELDPILELAEERGEEMRDRGLVGLEARDADERAGEIDQVRRVDLREHAVLGVAIHHGAT